MEESFVWGATRIYTCLSFGFSVSRRKLCGQNTLFCTGLKVSKRILANHCGNGSKTIE